MRHLRRLLVAATATGALFAASASPAGAVDENASCVGQLAGEQDNRPARPGEGVSRSARAGGREFGALVSGAARAEECPPVTPPPP